MANNRMSVRCERCGEMIGLAKAFGGGWYTHGRPEMSADWDAWFQEHASCSTGYGDPHDAVFRIVYETGEPRADSPLAPPSGVVVDKLDDDKTIDDWRRENAWLWDEVNATNKLRRALGEHRDTMRSLDGADEYTRRNAVSPEWVLLDVLRVLSAAWPEAAGIIEYYERIQARERE